MILLDIPLQLFENLRSYFQVVAYSLNCRYLTVDCTDRNITNVPAIPTTYETFLFGGNPELSIQYDSFHPYTSMRTLVLPESSAPYHDPRLFQNNTNLEGITFPSKRIANISPQLFKSTTKLEKLVGLTVFEIPTGLLHPLTNLKDLQVETSQTSLDNQTFSQNTEMMDLLLKANSVLSIPDDLFIKNGWLGKVTLEIDSVNQVTTSVFKHLSSFPSVSLSGRELELGCSVIPGIYKLKTKISAARKVEACAFDKSYFPGSISLSNVQNLTCSSDLKNDEGYMNELSIMQSGLTELYGEW